MNKKKIKKEVKKQQKISKTVGPKKELTILQMVKDSLISLGYDGLYNSKNPCACLLNNLSHDACIDFECKAGKILSKNGSHGITEEGVVIGSNNE